MHRADRSTQPVFPLGSVVLPGVLVPLRIFENRYRALAQELSSVGSDRRFATVMIERGSEVGGSDTRSNVGCVLEVVSMHQHADNTWSIAAAATSRLRVVEWLDDNPYPRAVVEWWPDDPSPPVSLSEFNTLTKSLHHLAETATGSGVEIRVPDVGESSITGAVWRVAACLPIGDLDRYRVLSAASIWQRFELVSELIVQQQELLDLMSQQGDFPNG